MSCAKGFCYLLLSVNAYCQNMTRLNSCEWTEKRFYCSFSTLIYEMAASSANRLQ